MSKAENKVSKWYVEYLAKRALEGIEKDVDYESAYRVALGVRHLGRRPAKIFVPKLGNTGKRR